MKNIFRVFVLFVIVFLSIEAYFHWDYLKVGKVLPPRILIENCEDIKAEIEKYDWDVEMATAIMKAESKCDTEAKGDTDLVFEENAENPGVVHEHYSEHVLGESGSDFGRTECSTISTNTLATRNLTVRKKWNDDEHAVHGDVAIELYSANYNRNNGSD